MAKIITYKILSAEYEREINGELKTEQIFTDKTILCAEESLEANEEIAKREAYNGEYTIEDDGQPDPADVPTQLDRVEAQVTYTAMMTDTLLEG